MDRYAGTATRSIELDDDSPLGTPERRRSLTESLGLAYSVSEENSTARVPSVEEQQLLDKIAEIQKKLDVSRAERIRIGEEEEHKTQVSHMAGRRLIMVSNRLPVSISKDKEGKWIFKMSSGGLVTALSGLKKEVPFLWVGWVGMSVPESERPILAQRLENELGLYPVFLPEDLVHKYYNGFCNDILWPLFHYTPLPDFEPGRDMKFDMGLWEAYLAANEAFTRVTLEAYKPGDLVWVHDYHLMVMPSQLRKSVPDMKIGWFLHTPFPALDMYRILPVRTEIMEGVLLADLVGFHTQDYAHHFMSASTFLMGLETEPEPRGVYLKGHFCVVGTYPIGIDPDVFDECLRKPHVQTRISELRMKFAGKKVIIGVDRLDYIKGMPHKLSALELFFIRYPQWRNKVVLIQIAVPSRTSVMQYKLLCSEVNELVGRINGSFGSFEFMPIHYLFQSVNLDELTALYTISDACIITSIRDGMNLVSYEYVACQRRHCGVLILSEFAGAAQTLTSAIRVNPWDSEEVADAIHRALTMPFPERQMREKRLFSHVSKNSASAWGLKFVNEMVRQAESSTGRHELVSSEVAKKIIASYREAKKRLIITDYGGTLVTPRAPTDSRPSPRVRKLLSALAKDPGTEVFLLSVRSCAWISQWFGGLKLGAFAEDGGYVSWPGSSIWEAVNQLSDDSWKEDIKLIMDEFASVTPGAYTRVMSNSMVWDYADVDPDFGSWQASYLERRLFEHVVAKSLPLQICSGRHELKVRPSGAGKGDLVRNILKHFDVGTFDFILCLGDDVFDEDMFVEVKKTAIPSVTCRVRNTVSKADYYLPSIHKAIELLETLCSS